MSPSLTVDALAGHLGLGSLLRMVDGSCGRHEMLAHWQQGEFHHGGVKEVLCFAEPPTEQALWYHRGPDNPEFAGQLPPILAAARTMHWFDPCTLLTDG